MDLKSLISKIQILCTEQNSNVDKMLKECDLNSSVVDNMKKGSMPSIDKVYAISNCLDCSIDYLLGRTDNSQSHKSAITTGDISVSHNSVVGDGHVGVSIHNGTDTSEQAAFLLNIFNNLNLIDKSKLLIYADELNKNK